MVTAVAVVTFGGGLFARLDDEAACGTLSGEDIELDAVVDSIFVFVLDDRPRVRGFADEVDGGFPAGVGDVVAPEDGIDGRDGAGFRRARDGFPDPAAPPLDFLLPIQINRLHQYHHRHSNLTRHFLCSRVVTRNGN
jgi:hypothetical protein